MSGKVCGFEPSVSITVEEAETIIAFVKSHEREDIPDGMWELHIKLWEALYEEDFMSGVYDELSSDPD